MTRLHRTPLWVVGTGLGLLAALVLVLAGLSMLSALEGVDGHLARMETSLQQIDDGVARMNGSQTGLTTIDARLGTLAASTRTIAREVAVSRTRITGLAAGTQRISVLLGQVGASTRTIHGQLERVSGQSSSLAGAVSALGTTVTPLLGSTASVNGSVSAMGDGIAGMNGSLRYTIRVLGYLAQPAGGGAFSVRVHLDPRTLPQLPGLKVVTDPVPVFGRGGWPTYRGP